MPCARSSIPAAGVDGSELGIAAEYVIDRPSDVMDGGGSLQAGDHCRHSELLLPLGRHLHHRRANSGARQWGFSRARDRKKQRCRRTYQEATSVPSHKSVEEFISRKVAKLAKKPLASLAALREAALEF